MMDIVNTDGRSQYVVRQSYPQIARVIASYKVGKMTKDGNLCKALFPCKDQLFSDTQVSFIKSLDFYFI